MKEIVDKACIELLEEILAKQGDVKVGNISPRAQKECYALAADFELDLDTAHLLGMTADCASMLTLEAIARRQEGKAIFVVRNFLDSWTLIGRTQKIPEARLKSMVIAAFKQALEYNAEKHEAQIQKWIAATHLSAVLKEHLFKDRAPKD